MDVYIDIDDFVGKPIVDSVFSGVNGTIVAYGQTSCGKTFTMEGMSYSEMNRLRERHELRGNSIYFLV